MFENVIVCANRLHATVGLWHRGKIISVNAFANDASGHHAFKQWLGRQSHVPISWIVDTADEDLRLETLPHVRGRARKEMLERKLNQFYRGIDFRTAQRIDREPSGRRDDRFLFMALTNPDVATPWMEIAKELDFPCAGIYLMSAVSQLLIEALSLTHDNLLLTTRNHTGLRQSHFTGPALRLSRLIPHSNAQHGLYASETEKTLLYLLNAQISALPTRLHLVFIGLEEADIALIKQLERHPEASISMIDTPVLAGQFGMDIDSLQRHPDLIPMHLLARRSLAANLAPAALTRPLRLKRLGLGLNIASGTVATAATLAAGMNVSAALHLDRESQQVAAQSSELKARYAAVSRQFPESPLSGSDLKAAVQLANSIDSANRTPLRLMRTIGSALEQQPEIRLLRLHWQIERSMTGELSSIHEIGNIEGEIANFSGDYSAALKSVGNLANRLKSDIQVEQVEVLQQPINTSSLETLQGNTLEQHAHHASATFKLKIVLKEPAA